MMISTSQKYLFITHRAYTNKKMKPAGIDQIINFLENSTVYLFEHPLESRDCYNSFLSVIQQKQKILLKQYLIWPRKAPWRWIGEILCSFFGSKELLKKEGITIIFAVDPLNALSVLPLKLFYYNLRIYFFSADYSDRRFKNYFLNSLYKFIHSLSLRLADKTFVVSKRICDFLSPRYPGKIIFLPNSPHFASIPRVEASEKKKFDLIICSRKLDEEVNLEGILKAVECLKVYLPEVKLHLIGRTGAVTDELIKKYNIAPQVIVHGFVSHEDTLKLVAASYIGLCWYKDGVSQFFWGDSLKIREYAAAGLPIVCDGITSTAQEMEKYRAGFIIKTSIEMAEKIRNLITDQKLYNEKRKNSLFWAASLDKSKILEKIFKEEKIFIS